MNGSPVLPLVPGAENFTRLRLTVGPFPVAFLGSRFAQTILARLRLGVTDLAASSSARTGCSPLCDCRRDHETVSHFLLHCLLHARHRTVMFQAVHTVFQGDITEEVLLGVAPVPRSKDRLVVVNAVFAFVMATGRRI